MTHTPAPTFAIEAEALRFSYGTGERRTEILHGVSLNVPRGEMLAVLGPNGSGKSTLIRILTTMAVPESGAARVMGIDAAGSPYQVRSQIGVTFQSPALDRKLKARENLYFHGRIHGMHPREIRTATTDLLERFGLAESADRPVEQLSGGMQRRLELAKSLLHSPSVLLLDEPTNGLDPNAREEFFTILADERTRRGMSVVFSTHILDDAERCDSVVILDEGRIVAQGTPSSLKQGLGREIISLETGDPDALAARLKDRHGIYVVAGRVRLPCDDAAHLLPGIMEAGGGLITGFSCSRPTLGDLFARITGKAYAA